MKIKDIILLLLSSLLMAIAVNFFIAGYSLTPGGTTGISICLSIITGVSVSVASLLITVPLLILGSLVLGQAYGVKTLLVIIAMPIFMAILPEQMIISNILISGMIGGCFAGVGISIAIYDNCSTGGTDLIAMVLNKYFPRFKIASWMLLIDSMVVLSSGLLTNKIMTAVYSGISLLVINLVIRGMLRVLKVN